ncbi:MAG: RNA polymerase-associated protein RapA [Pseudomonadales bacterium]|nr:RNA polymerase-associated protein RapA [Pseudomonadales bacterium]
MRIEEFVPGQRWISNTESELGLGIIVSSENRRIEVSYPAVAERRTYATDNAPLSRVIYNIGEQISDQQGVLYTIQQRLEEQGCFIYQCSNGSNETVAVAEIELDSFVHFSKPQDRLFAGQIDKLKSFRLRVETLDHQHNHQQSGVCGLLGPRVQLLPHQFYIASQVANRHAPRVLLADEVGLGKTVEAGLILHQQLITDRAQRILIIVPDSLVHQWLVEMLRRFNLMYSILDENRCLAIEHKTPDIDLDLLEDDQIPEQMLEINPFESSQLILCSLGFLTENPHRVVQAESAQWDLLIVDEAHHLEWSETQASPQYQLIEALAKRTAGLLLLTATPEQLGVEGHFARLRLLDPDRYYDLQKFKQEEQDYRPLSDFIKQLLAADAATAIVDKCFDQQLQQYLGPQQFQEFQQQISVENAANSIETIIEQLLDQHGTGRVLFRNTRAAITGFPKRELHPHPLPKPELYEAIADEISNIEKLQPELVSGQDWLYHDSRVTWLVDWLKQYRYEKILLICANAETAIALEDHLRLREGVRSAAFHEGMSLINRDRAAAYFANLEDNAQILICSEIGSEGRNFQFASKIVLFDLPLNPDLLEQRIGRLDRIGQENNVQIHVPYYQDSAQQVLMQWYHQGCNAFEHSCSIGMQLFAKYQQRLFHCFDSTEQQEVDELLELTRNRRKILEQQLHLGRDQMLELNSCRKLPAQKILEQVEQASSPKVLAKYIERLCDYFGVDVQPYDAYSFTLHPGDHMRTHHFPGLPEDGITTTWDRDHALSRDDLQFLSWEHPLVIGAMDMMLSGDYGNTAFCTLKLPPLQEGSLLIEAIFTPHCAAPKSLQLNRYIEQGTHRILLDSNDTDLSTIISSENIDTLAQRVPNKSAQNLIKHARDQIEQQIVKIEKIAKTQQPAMIDKALANINSHMEIEISRLQALASINPNIRDSEIQYQREALAQLQQYASSLQLKLEAIRVIIVTA